MTLALLVSAVLIQIPLISSQIQEILAAQAICYDATQYSEGNSFSAPMDGDLIGVRLVHQSGAVNCDTSGDFAPTNFGCLFRPSFDVSVISDDSNLQPPVTYYPTATTQNITYIEPYVLGECIPDRCGTVYYYEMEPSLNPNDDELILRDPDNPYSVTTDNTFSLQYGEGCCDITSDDNEGIACADVYFLYLSDEMPTTTTTTTDSDDSDESSDGSSDSSSESDEFDAALVDERVINEAKQESEKIEYGEENISLRLSPSLLLTVFAILIVCMFTIFFAVYFYKF